MSFNPRQYNWGYSQNKIKDVEVDSEWHVDQSYDRAIREYVQSVIKLTF